MFTRRAFIASSLSSSLVAGQSFATTSADSARVRWDSYAPEVLASDSLPMRWNHEFLVAIRVIAPPPTVAARHLAILHTAMYNAWAAYDGKALDTQLGSQLRRPTAERTEANRWRAVSYAAYLAAIDQFPSQAEQFRSFMRDLGYDPNHPSSDPTQPDGIAAHTVQHLLAYRHHDGSNQLGSLNRRGVYTDHTGYVVYRPDAASIDHTRWRPLEVGNGMGGFNDIDAQLRKIGALPRQKITVELGGYVQQRYATPHWGTVLPMALESVLLQHVNPPLRLTASDLTAGAREDNETYPDLDALDDLAYPKTFRDQVRQTLRYSARLSDTEKAKVEYWADGPLSESPSGHWNVLAHYLARKRKHNADDDIKMFFTLNMALLDASIVAWHTKRVFNYVRPVAAVRAILGDAPIRAWAGPVAGVQTIPASQWLPYQEKYFVTPPFPEHVSGHSTFSFAAATALRLHCGGDAFGAHAVVSKGSSSIEIGRGPRQDVKLQWNTLSEAALEAALSRRFGGLHFAAGDLEGRRLGLACGESAFKVAEACIQGRSTPRIQTYRNHYAPAAS